MPRNTASDLGLHYLLRPDYLKTFVSTVISILAMPSESIFILYADSEGLDQHALFLHSDKSLRCMLTEYMS